MSVELQNFLHSRGITTRRTTPFNPRGNGQTERFNGIIWKAVNLALHSRNLPVTAWETVLTDVLHSLRSLLCTATNNTSHERMLLHQRCSVSRSSVPIWLTTPGKVLLRRNVRSSKYEPLVDDVDLIEPTNPAYAHVQLPNGRETTVSIRHLTPRELIYDENVESSEQVISNELSGYYTDHANEYNSNPSTVEGIATGVNDSALLNRELPINVTDNVEINTELICFLHAILGQEKNINFPQVLKNLIYLV